MAAHILLISAVAPALVYAATAQLALLWAWHAPTTLSVSSTHEITHALASVLFADGVTRVLALHS